MTKTEAVKAAVELLVKQSSGHLELIELLARAVESAALLAAQQNGEGKERDEAVVSHYFQLLQAHVADKEHTVLLRLSSGAEQVSDVKLGDYVPASYYASQYGEPLSQKTKFTSSDGWLDKDIFEHRFASEPKIKGLSKTQDRWIEELCKRMFLAGVSHEQAMRE